MRPSPSYRPDKAGLERQAQRNLEVTRVSDTGSLLRPYHHMNSMLFIIVLIMICYGLVMLFSASMSDGYASYDGNSMYYVIKQASITAAGLILALFIAIVLPIRLFDHVWLAGALYLVTSALLVYVKFKGQVINNARRWVVVGPINIQPSEVAKIAAVFCLAAYFSWIRKLRRKGRLRCRTGFRQFIFDGWVDILLPAFSMLGWLGLIVWQPHLSATIILAFIIFAVFCAAGLSARSWVSGILQALAILLIIVVIAAAVLPILMPDGKLQKVVEQNFAHVGQRVDTFMNPDEASSDDDYQTRQSIIAIGSGGLLGVGLGEGRQKYNYLPEAHNDYVFAIIGEELGLIGTLSVLLLFLCFLILGISVALKASGPFPAMLATGYTMLISVQALLNIGVATRTLPATGISLPFFSYGGTSNLLFLTGIGLLLCVSRTGQRSSRQQALLLTPNLPSTRRSVNAAGPVVESDRGRGGFHE